MSDATEARIWQSLDLEVVGESPEKIISEIRNRASELFKKFTIREIKYRWAGTTAADGDHLWLAQATVMEDTSNG